MKVMALIGWLSVLSVIGIAFCLFVPKIHNDVAMYWVFMLTMVFGYFWIRLAVYIDDYKS